jgi:hypothetical protein
LIPAPGIGVASLCLMSRHEAAPPRHNATPYAKPPGCHITRGASDSKRTKGVDLHAARSRVTQWSQVCVAQLLVDLKAVLTQEVDVLEAGG